MGNCYTSSCVAAWSQTHMKAPGGFIFYSFADFRLFSHEVGRCSTWLQIQSFHSFHITYVNLKCSSHLNLACSYSIWDVPRFVTSHQFNHHLLRPCGVGPGWRRQISRADRAKEYSKQKTSGACRQGWPGRKKQVRVRTGNAWSSLAKAFFPKRYYWHKTFKCMFQVYLEPNKCLVMQTPSQVTSPHRSLAPS